MKQLPYFILILICLFQAQAQHSPEQIQKIINEDFLKINKTYEPEDALDSILQHIDGYLLAAKTLSAHAPSPEITAEIAIWHHLKATLLGVYINRNRYNIEERIPLAATENPPINRQLWDISTFYRAILHEFDESLHEKATLTQIPITNYSKLWELPLEKRCYQTLYDLLAYGFADFLTQDFQQELLNDPFNLNNPDFFHEQLPALSCTDSLSINYHFLHLMDEIAHAHTADTSSIYRNYNYLVRIRYLQKHATYPQRDSLFLHSLTQIRQTTPEKHILCQLLYGEFAEFYHRKSNETTEYWDGLAQAVNWYKRAIAISPESQLSVNFHNAIAIITNPEVQIQTQRELYPEENFLQVVSRNCDTVYFAIARLKNEQNPFWVNSSNSVSLNIIDNKTVNVSSNHIHREDSTLIIVPALTPGPYLFIASPTPISSTISKDEYQKIGTEVVMVSQLGSRYVASEKEVEVWVFDTKSGAPISDVKVTLNLENTSTNKHIHSETISTSAAGYAVISLQNFLLSTKKKYQEHYVLEISKGNDVRREEHLCLPEQQEVSTELRCIFFTDRAIYRPGQMIQWKVILTQQKGFDETLVCHQKVELILSAANGTTVLRDTVTTNEFGAATGSWELPTNGYLGRYIISAKYKNRPLYQDYYFQVEEYKRPSFEVTLAQPKETFTLDKDVLITGAVTAYSGYPIQNATVNYRVVRTISSRWHNWWCVPRTTIPDKEITNGVCPTDANGNFVVAFTAESATHATTSCPIYTFTVYATVTDLSGEMHETKLPIWICEQTLQFKVDMPAYLLATTDTPSVPLRVLNLSGEPQKVEVHYAVKQLIMPANYLLSLPFEMPTIPDTFCKKFPQYAFLQEDIPETWREDKIVSQGLLQTHENSTLFIKELSQLPTGAYKLELATTDTFGKTITEELLFYWLQNNNNSFPIYSPLEIITDKGQAKIGETITFRIGSYLENQYLFLRISNNDKLLINKWIRLNKSTYSFSHLIKEGEEGVFTCAVYTTWNGQNFEKSSSIIVPQAHRTICFEFDTFRDKLLPGAREQVKIRLTDAAGNSLPHTELLCMMYDAALDAFAPRPSLPAIFPFRHPQLRPLQWTFNHWNLFTDVEFYYHYNEPSDEFLFRFPTWKKLPAYYPMIVFDTYRAVNGSSAALPSSRKDGLLTADIAAKGTAESEIIAPQTATPRSNFNETAFFYPLLHTRNGIIEFEYTIPESLTKWKMQGAAHTTAQQFGYFEKIVQTQKPLMVKPHAPRFVYEGDSLNFSATIVATELLTNSATVTFQLRNSIDDSILHTDTQTITIGSTTSTAVAFPVKIPYGLTSLRYQIMVEAAAEQVTYRDGETNMLPVLARRQLLTETLPIFITKKGTKSFSFNNLPAANEEIESGKLYFTPTPMWNVLLALPYLVNYPYDCNEQLFSKLYATTAAASIANKHPKLCQLIDNYIQKSPAVLRSNLSQNAELKQILLEETPWVADALNEDNEIQNIAYLFDQTKIAEQQRNIVQKLERNQNQDGGWSWFTSDNQQPSSAYITRHLLIGAGRLLANNICKEGENFLKKNTLKQAVHFIDNHIQNEYLKLTRDSTPLLDSNYLTPNILHYLYAKSFYLTTGEETNEAYKFYKNQLVKYASKLPTIYQKTMAALTLFQTNETGDRALARRLMTKIMTYAIVSEELGMYWKREGFGWFWYDAPIERQALLIEAAQTILHDTDAVKAMKVWLLQQKRTQHWESTRATADACYALFLEDNSAQNQTDNTVSIKIDEKEFHFTDTIQPPLIQNITPYLQQANDSKITLSRTHDALSYGGVFVQYHKDIDDIQSTSATQPLSVQRQLYREIATETGLQLTAVTEDTPLHVGDKVHVRLTLRADRDMEFVHLKDLRAAAFEPIETLSGYRWHAGVGYYQSFRDASVNFFFDWLSKGTYLFEYTLFVTQGGAFTSGYATVQCLYAHEFSAHSSGGKHPITILRE